MIIKKVKGLRGEIQIPGDKSISHRAIILGSLASGETRIKGLLESEDCLNTLKAFQSMGVVINKIKKGEYQIKGVGEEGLSQPDNIIDCGNSGTSMRLLTGLLAAQPFYTVLTGDNSLRQRPMARIIKPLEKMGAEIWARNNNYAPLSIKGQNLYGLEYQLPVASAQVKTALLLAGLYTQGEVKIKEPAPCRDHSEIMLKAFGINIDIDQKDRQITLPEGGIKQLVGQEIMVPADISSAAYFIAAALITADSSLFIKRVGINQTRNGLLEVLQEMGAEIEIKNKSISNGEPVADILVQSSKLKGVTVQGEIIPRLIDEIPIIAVLASQAEGKTIIKDAEELRVKESDRIKTMVSQLAKLGVEIKELPDGMVIEGPAKLKGGLQLDSYNDHRVAMALAIAGLQTPVEIKIRKSEAVLTSFPNFMQILTSCSY